MLDDSSHHSVRPKNRFWTPFRLRHWGESVAYAFIFLAGLSFFLIQFWTWAVPQLTLLQEFVPSRGVVRETRIAEKLFDGQVVYRPEVLLEYTVHGTSYRVWTFDYQTFRPKEGFSPNRPKVEAALAPFTDGSEVDCWYRVDRPEQVVVVWEASLWGWFFLALSFSLVVLGTIGFCQSFRLKAVSEERRRALLTVRERGGTGTNHDIRGRNDWPTVPDIRVINESPGTNLAFRLPLENQPIFPLVGMTLFALSWIAVAFGIVLHSVVNPVDGWSDQVIGLVLRGLFCGVGLLLLVWVTHRILLAFSLSPTLLEISDHPIYPGRRYRVLVQQAGVVRFRELGVDVVCEEIARFRQGTDTITSRRDVFRQSLFERKDFETSVDVSLNEEFFLQLPFGAMHSFRQENNEIVWKIAVTARIADWPDLCRECTIVVRPSTWNDSIQEGIGL